MFTCGACQRGPTALAVLRAAQARCIHSPAAPGTRRVHVRARVCERTCVCVWTVRGCKKSAWEPVAAFGSRVLYLSYPSGLRTKVRSHGARERECVFLVQVFFILLLQCVTCDARESERVRGKQQFSLQHVAVSFEAGLGSFLVVPWVSCSRVSVIPWVDAVHPVPCFCGR